MQESTATIKLTKSEIEWTIIALVWIETTSKEFRRPQDANMFKKIREDLIKIKEDIIQGEKKLETKNETEEENRTGPQACDDCID